VALASGLELVGILLLCLPFWAPFSFSNAVRFDRAEPVAPQQERGVQAHVPPSAGRGNSRSLPLFDLNC
jgi:hypothetical protein